MSARRDRPHVGVDVRLRAYRIGGIAEHGAMLLAGLSALDEIAGPTPSIRVTAIEHARRRREVEAFDGRRVDEDGRPDAEGHPDRGDRVVLDDRTDPGDLAIRGDRTDRRDRDDRGGRATRPIRPIGARFVLTPPHHRLEDVALPFELAFGPRLDLLHSPDFIVPSGWRGAAVATVHDLAFLRHPEGLTDESRRYYGRVHRSVRRAERVIAVSEHTRRELLALTDVDPERVRVVHNALRPAIAAAADLGRGDGSAGDRASAERVAARDLERVAARDAERLAARDAENVARALGTGDPPRPFVLFVSTIEPRKDAGTLLAAFRRLLDEGRDLDLALVGADGWNSESVYATWRELGLEARARFVGACDGETLVSLYRNAAVLAHPARDEGFGLTPLEAMALGTPVVVSDAGALPEVVGEAGLRVPPGEPAAWAAALGRVLDDPGLAARLRALGPERAAGFTLERMARGTLEVYREALAEHGAPRDRRTAGFGDIRDGARDAIGRGEAGSP